MKRVLTTIAAVAVLLSGAFGTAGVAAAAPPDRPSFKEIFEIRWGGPSDPYFLHLPNMVTPVTPDGAWICLVPGAYCLRSESYEAIKKISDELEAERKKQNAPKPTGGGSGGGGSLGGGITIISIPNGSNDSEERYGTVGEVENVQ